MRKAITIRREAVLAFVCVLTGGGCSSDDSMRPDTRASGVSSAQAGQLAPAAQAVPMKPKPDPDAFWAQDPPPMSCFEDGTRAPSQETPGGTPECPDDKNREGCECGAPGKTAACWPGLRAQRNHGICRDGMTTCEPFGEFASAWGPCMGYVLPVRGALAGPSACRCFSAGRWEIDNVSPCFVGYPDGTVYAVSTVLHADGTSSCPEVEGDPPPMAPAGMPWSANRLTVDCAGRFELCFTIKAGNGKQPSAGDCELARACVSDWYETAGKKQEFPALPAWSSADTSCVQKFQELGGYGEMSVRGLSLACDPIDDGNGAAHVFQRASYCPSSCRDMPMAPECQNCKMGGSGSF